MAKALPTNGLFEITHIKTKHNNDRNAERLHMSAEGQRRESTQASENDQGRLHDKGRATFKGSQGLDKMESRNDRGKNSILPFYIFTEHF